jgi:hypothetical protein
VTLLGNLRKSLFGIPFEKELFDRPEFAKEATQLFQHVAHALVEGYHAALENGRPESLAPRLNAVELAERGFAYEGAGMGLMVLDTLMPWKNHLQTFVDGPGAAYLPLLYIGAGLTLARLGKQPERLLERLDPVQGWFVVDGYGFHEGFFSYYRTVEEHVVPAKLSLYARRIFDQGLGRSIWFSSGTIVDRVATILDAFPLTRQADLWNGVGLACAYAGGADRATLEKVRDVAGPYKSQLAQGAAIAANGRLQAGNLAPHTDLACEVFCGLSGKEAAQIANKALQDLPVDGAEPAYEIWRQRTLVQFVA